MSQNLMETLDKMAADRSGKSQTARLRAVFDHVDKALRSGVSRQAVMDVLNQDGFTFSMQSFEKALYRIRKSQSVDATTKSISSRHTGDTQDGKAPAPTVLKALEMQSQLPSITPASFKEIRKQNEERDWLALSQPVPD